MCMYSGLDGQHTVFCNKKMFLQRLFRNVGCFPKKCDLCIVQLDLHLNLLNLLNLLGKRDFKLEKRNHNSGSLRLE